MTKKLIFAVLVVAIIIAVGIAAWLAFGPGSDVRGLRYLSGSFTNRTLHEFKTHGTREVILPVPGRVIDYARNGNTEAAIVVSDDGRQDVHTIRGDAADQRTFDGKPKTSLAVSADGSFAYAVRTEAEAGNAVEGETSTVPGAYFNYTDWFITYVPVEGAPQQFGAGFAPQFFERDGNSYLSYTTASSIHIVELATNTHQEVTISLPITSAVRSAVVSMDGRFVALPDPASGYFMYELTQQNGSFTLAPREKLPDETSILAFAGADSVFSISYDGTAGTLLRTVQPSSPSTVVRERALPFTIITKLIP